MALSSALTAFLALGLGVGAAPTKRADSPFSFYEMPTDLSGPCDLTTGPDGALWVQDQLVNKLARIDVNTGEVDEYEIPFTLPILNVTLPNVAGRTVLGCGIQPGADGHLYASNGMRNQLVKMNVTTKEIEVLTPTPFDPAGNLEPFNDLFTGPDGMFFTQSTGNVVTYYEYATGLFTNFPIPTLLAGPLGMFYASDGGAWFCELLGQKIGRLDPKTGVITEYPVPASLLGPAVMRVETEGKYLWFTATVGNALGRLTMATGEFMAFTNTNLASLPSEDTLDGDGNVWYSTMSQNILNQVDPSTGELTHIVVPGTIIPVPVSVPFYFEVAIHYGPGNAIYFTSNLVNRVGRYQL